jgi:site-specific DNA-adenine methylase
MIEKISEKKSSIRGCGNIKFNTDGGKMPSVRAENGRSLHGWCREEIKTSIDEKNEMDTACWWYILNKTSYSGMAMIGSYAPLAWDQNFGDRCINNLKNTYTLMRSVSHPIKITCEDYSNLLTKDGNDVFIFLDPPYEISHSLYGEQGNMHRGFDHGRFAAEIESCKHKWMITYNDNPEIIKRFEKYEQEKWDLTYTMKAATRLDKDKADIKAKVKDGEKEREHNQTDKCGKKGKELLIWNWK